MSELKGQIEIVRATVEDVPQVAPLFDAYRQFYRQPSDLAGAQVFLSRLLHEDSSVVFLALRDADEGERVVCGFTQLFPTFSTGVMKRLWILNDLFVAPEARKLGVGRALMERARAFAVETEARGLTLKTAVDNYPAQALYESCGWQRDEQFFSYNLYF